MPDGVVLAFDFGEKRIGVAVGNTSICQAAPLDVVRNVHGRPDWDNISSLISEWKPVALVVGLPVTEDGREQQALVLSNAFSKQLRKRYGLPVYRSDERYSSVEAAGIIAENRRRGNRRKSSREDTDKIAAALILEHWFEYPTSEQNH